MKGHRLRDKRPITALHKLDLLPEILLRLSLRQPPLVELPDRLNVTLRGQVTRGWVQVDAIVFLVDSADPERFPEAKKELDSLLSEDYLGQVRLPTREWSTAAQHKVLQSMPLFGAEHALKAHAQRFVHCRMCMCCSHKRIVQSVEANAIDSHAGAFPDTGERDRHRQCRT